MHMSIQMDEIILLVHLTMSDVICDRVIEFYEEFVVVRVKYQIVSAYFVMKYVIDEHDHIVCSC